MKIRCNNCSAAYAVDDAKVEGKKFGFECPKCGTSVVIDNRRAVSAAFAEQKAPAVQKEIPAAAPEDDFAAAADLPDLDAPSFETSEPAAEETAFDESSFELPSFEEPLSETAPSEEESPAEDETKYADYEDEIEPEIDLSVLQPKGETEEAASDDFLTTDFSGGLAEEDLSAGTGAGIETIAHAAADDEDDESITIDLNSLDIDLSEPEEISAGETVEADFAPVAEMDGLSLSEENDLPSFEEETAHADEEPEFSAAADDDDESVTIDLESLDIALEENDEIHPGEMTDDDESRLSLNDAGLTLDDVESQETMAEDEQDNDELHLSLDEVNAGLDLDEINEFEDAEIPSGIGEEIDAYSSQEPISDSYTSDMLPEVDLERFGTIQESETSSFAAAPVEDQYLDIESRKGYNCNDDDALCNDSETVAASGGGYVNFSVDYAFHYSRLNAFLRLIGVYYITFLPHLVVLGIYSVIASVTGTINWLLILFTGSREKDFSMMQEQTIRYAQSLLASMLNITEDKPSFAGRKNIDYQLQLNVVYPPKYSRVLAFLRLTGIGICIAALPHLVLLLVLSVGMSLITIVSLVYTLIMGRWPSMTFDFMVRYLRYSANVSAYMFGLIDSYPSFRFE